MVSKGFFEDKDISRLNIELMFAAGVDWHALQAPNLGCLTSEQLDDFRNRALALLREKCQKGIFALKDPRIARLLHFWQPIFDTLDVRVLYVVAFRHPISVARSLLTRNSMPLEKSYLLWLAHVVPALQHTTLRQRAFVNYDDMMEMPRSALGNLASGLGLPLEGSKLDAFERDFLEDGLRHTRFGSTDLDRAENAPLSLKSLFAALEAHARKPTVETNQRLNESLAGADAFLTDMAPLLARDWQFESHLDEMRARVDQLTHTLSLANDRIQTLDHAQQLAQSRISTLELHCAELERIRVGMHATAGTFEHNQHAMEATAHTRQLELEQAAIMLQAVLNSTSWRITAPLRAIRKLFS